MIAYVLYSWPDSTNILEGVFIKVEDVIRYILETYDYFVKDFSEYSTQEEIDEFNNKLNEARQYWKNYDFDKLEDSCSAYNFKVTKTKILKYH